MTKYQQWFALTGIGLASFLGCIDFTIVNTALPTIQTTLNASITQLQWVITIFLLVLTSTMVIVGKISDSYGYKFMLYLGILIFGLASLGAGLSENIYYLIFFRALQGVGVAILYTVPIVLVNHLFPPHQSGKAAGILIGINGFGLAIGPVIGGFILSVSSWRWVFFINLPIILLSFLLCIFTLTAKEEEKKEKNKINFLDFIFLSLGLSTFVLATTQGNTWGWKSFLTLSFYLLALINLSLFYIFEKKKSDSIIDFQLFKNKKFIAGTIANASLAFYYTLAFFLIPLYLHNVLHKTSSEIGLALLPTTLMVALLSPFVGNFVDKKGPKNILLLGFALLFFSAFMQIHFNLHTSFIFILLAFILFGTGWACILNPSVILTLMSLPQEKKALAMGTFGTLHNLGGALGLAIGTVIYQYAAEKKLASYLGIQPWVKQAVINPQASVNIIIKNTSFSLEKSLSLFQLSFLQGYATAMTLLLVVSIGGFLCVAGLFKK